MRCPSGSLPFCLFRWRRHSRLLTIIRVGPGGALQGVSPFACLGGGVTVASLSVRRVDVEGGYTHLHIGGGGPSQQVILVGGHRAARTLGVHVLLSLPLGCVSALSRPPGGVAPLTASSAVITVISVVSSTITLR